MSSMLMDIADTMAIDFREAVMDAEKADMVSIEQIMQEMNNAWTDYSNKDAVLNTKAEQAVRTLAEISDLRDNNHTTYQRRIEALRTQLKEFKETKAPKLDPVAQAQAMGMNLKVVT